MHDSDDSGRKQGDADTARDTIRHGWNTKRFAIVARSRLAKKRARLLFRPAFVRSFVPSFVRSRENLYAAGVENRYLLIYAPPREFNILGASGARAATDSLFPQSTGQQRVGELSRATKKRKRNEGEMAMATMVGRSKRKKIVEEGPEESLSGGRACFAVPPFPPTFASRKGLTTRTSDSRIRHASLSLLPRFLFSFSSVARFRQPWKRQHPFDKPDRFASLMKFRSSFRPRTRCTYICTYVFSIRGESRRVELCPLHRVEFTRERDASRKTLSSFFSL